MSTKNVIDPLFELIQSMSSTEKRYFKRQALVSGDKQPNYLKLFDAINKMETYDENKLRVKLKIKNWAVERKYLYDAILKSLRNYHRDDSSKAQISDLLLDASYLYERGLYDQSQRRLRAARKMAEQFENLSAQIEVITLERAILMNRGNEKFQDNWFKLIEERDRLLVLIKGERACKDLSEELMAKMKRLFLLEGSEQKINFEKDYEKKFADIDEAQLSPDGERYFYQAKLAYHHLLGNNIDKESFAKKIVDWWEARPNRKYQEFTLFINSISNHLGICFTLKRYDKIQEILHILDELRPKKPHDQAMAFKKKTYNRLLFYLSTGDIDPIRGMIADIDKGIRKNKLSKDQTIAIQANIALFFFLKEEWGAFLEKAEELIRPVKYQQRVDVQILLRLLYLAASHESDSTDRIDSALRSAKRYFQQLEIEEDGFEFEMLNTFKLFFSAPVMEHRKILQTWRVRVEQFFKENQHTAKGVDLLLLWIDSKLTKQPVLKVYRKHLENN